MQKSLLSFGFCGRSSEKRKGNERDSSESDGETENKCSNDAQDKKKKIRKFSELWKKEYPWVNYDADKNMMFCAICLRYPKLADNDGRFFTGSNNFKKEALQLHSKTHDHVKCVEADKVEKNPQMAPLPTAVRKLSNEQRIQLEHLFNTAYFVAKKVEKK